MAATSHHLPVRVRLFRWACRPLFRALYRLFSPIKITGLENVPKRGAYIIVINHVSLFDAPFLLAFWPVAPEAVGAIEVWHRTGQSFLVRWYGGIPIRRGQYNRRELQLLLSVLNAGRPLLIAPEGGRSHTPGLRRAFPGVAYLVEKSGVPVVPVGIVGATDDYLRKALRAKRPPLEMHIGKPFRPDLGGVRGRLRGEARQRLADQIMYQVAALLPPEYRGVYAEGILPSAEAGQ